MHPTMDDEDSLDILQQIMKLNILDSETCESAASGTRGHANESVFMVITEKEEKTTQASHLLS
jgi:hypothetical protein